MLVCWAIRSTSPRCGGPGRPGLGGQGATEFPVLPPVGAASGLAACEWRRFCGLSLPGLVSLRRAVVSATGPLIRPGRDLLLVRGCLGAGYAGAPFFLPRAKHLACPGCPVAAPPYARRGHLTAGKGPAVPGPPPGRPALPVTAPGGPP